MQIIKKNPIPVYILLFVLFSNIFFGYGFQIFNIFNIPINYIFLIIFIFFLKIQKSANYLFQINLFNLIILFIIFNFFKLLMSYSSYGIYAIRDSTYVFDLFFIVISFSIFHNYFDTSKILKVLNLIFYLTLIFIFMWFFKDFFQSFSIRVGSPTGASADLFFNFSTIALLSIWFAFYNLILFPNEKNHSKKYLLFFLLIAFSVVFFQRRSIYLCLVAIFFISLFFNKRETLKVFIILMIGSLIIPLANLFGISFTGYLGEVSSIFFFVEHFLSALPGYKHNNEIFESTSGTANLRLDFWKYVIETQLSNIKFLFFGQDYGAPLVYFKATGGIPVREPHNMYLTVFARTGLFGLIIFILIHFRLLAIWIYSFKLSLKKEKRKENQILIFLGIYLLFIYIIGLTDSVLVANYHSIVFNIFWGIVISIYFKLKENENTSNT